jgi:peptidyl-prolyl cis-trans isomerase C
MENMKKPLAIINTKAIYESDIDEMIEQMGQRGAAYRSEQGRAIILEQLIAQRLFMADAMRNLYEREPEFKAQLAKVKEQMLIQYAINKAVGSVKVTDDEAKKFFDEFNKDYDK